MLIFTYINNVLHICSAETLLWLKYYDNMLLLVYEDTDRFYHLCNLYIENNTTYLQVQMHISLKDFGNSISRLPLS